MPEIEFFDLSLLSSHLSLLSSQKENLAKMALESNFRLDLCGTESSLTGVAEHDKSPNTDF